MTSPNLIAPAVGVVPVTGGSIVYLVDIDFASITTGDKVASTDLRAVGDGAAAGFRSFRPTVAPATVSVPPVRLATVDMTFPPTDPQAPNVWYAGRVRDAGSVTHAVALGAASRPGVAYQRGQITLDNGDGALDTLPEESLLINAPITVSVGLRDWTRDQFTVMWTGFVKGVDVGLEEATVDITGTDAVFSSIFFDQTYKGTGGLEGDASLVGTRKPFAIGRCRNITPIMIDPLRYIFQAHAEGAIGAITRVRFGGVELVNVGNVADLTALETATVEIGEYLTCREQGLIRAGLTQGLANFELTADVTGILGTQAAQIAINTVFRLSSQMGIGVDQSLLDLSTAFPDYIYGRYITRHLSYIDVLNDMFSNLNVYWGVTREGLLGAAWLEPPENADPIDSYIGEADIVDIDRLALPTGFEFPHGSRTGEYRRNWTTQNTVAAIIDNLAWQTQYEDRTVYNPAPLTNEQTPAALVLNLQEADDVDDLFMRLLDLHGKIRRVYSAKIPLGATPGLLSKVNLTYSRLGLSGGRDLRVIAIEENYEDNTAQLTLWG